MTPGDNDIVITGLGVVSPLGHSAAELAQRVCRGERALRPLTDMGDAGVLGAVVDTIPLHAIPSGARTRIGRLDRLCRLFLSAAFLAVHDARLEITAAMSERTGLSFGTGLGCLLTNAEYFEKVVEQGPTAASPRLFAYTVSSAAAGEASIALGIKGPNLTSHAGLAAGLQAIGYAGDLIRTGKADVVLAGGADALGPALLQGLAAMGLVKTRAATPFTDATAGMCPAEGAAVIVLERHTHAQRRGARCIAAVDGYAAGFEPTLTRRTAQPTALVETMQRALTASRRPAAAIDAIIAGAHGTAIDRTELAAFNTVCAPHAPLVFAPKAAWGESGAASGALAVAFAAQQLHAPLPIADHVTWELNGAGLAGAAASGRWTRPSLAMVHALCYSGPTVALILSREGGPT